MITMMYFCRRRKQELFTTLLALLWALSLFL